MMPASKRQRTYEDVFREFVQSSLDEEKKRSPAPSSGSAGGDGTGAAEAAADDAADAAGADDADASAGDGGSAAAPPVRRGRGRGRRRRGGLGRRRSAGGGGGDGSSGSEREGAEERSPPAKRACGRGRGRGRGRLKVDLGSSSSSSDRAEPAADAAPNTDSNGPDADGEEGGGRRRSSRRTKARAVDFTSMLEDEDEDDPGAADSDASRGLMDPAAGDESGDDWKPPANGARSSGDEADGKGADDAPCRRGRGRGRPPSRGFRGRGRGSRGGGGSGGDEGGSSEAKVTRYKLPEELAAKVNTPPAPTDISPAATQNSSLKTGDFLICAEDIDLDRPPIWRIDGKFLIQKYEPMKCKGQRLYKNVATYMSWSANTDKFRPVSVRYHQMGRSEIIVELLDNPHSSTFNLSKMLSIESTSKYLENFEIYMQTLISQALDANFLLEITQEGDEYFMKNVSIVNETNLLRKNKIIELKSWDENVQEELDTLPVLELVLLRNVPPSECAVCHQTANARLVQLYGRPYDRTTLLTRQDEGGASGKRQHNMCSFCGGLADLYNKVEHLTYHLYLRCCEKVSQRRKEAPDDDSTRILNDILADEQWLSKAFSDVQQIWGDVDQIYTAAKEDEEEQAKDAGKEKGKGGKSTYGASGSK